MFPQDFLAALGLEGGYNSPEMQQGQFTAPSQDAALAEAKVLAKLKPRQASGMDRFAAGLGAKTGRAPSNNFAAFADGAMSGFTGAYGAGRKDPTKDIKERMGILKELFGMERQLRNDQALQKYRKDSLDVSRERNRSYGGGGRGRDPLLREKNLRELLEKHPAHAKLSEDDSLSATSPRKLKPEERAKLESALAAERARLEALDGGSVTPATPATPDTPKAAPADRSIPSMHSAPSLPGPEASTPAPDRAAPAPAKAPKFSREQLVPAALEKMKQGVPMDAIIAGAKERYGIDLSPQDFGIPPTPQAPQPQAATDPMGVPTGGDPTMMAPPAAGGGGITDILKSLFGG